MVQKKKSTGVQLRTPKTKSKLGLSVPRIGMPHDEFVRSESSRETELMSVLGLTSPTGASDRASRTDMTGQSVSDALTATTGQAGHTSQTSPSESNEISDVAEYPEPPAIIEVREIEIIPEQVAPRRNELPEQNVAMLTSQSGQTSLFTPTPVPTFPTAPADPLPGKSRALYAALYQVTHGAANPASSVRMRRSDLMRLAGIGSRNTFIANMKRLETAGLVTQTVIVGEADGNEFHVADLPDALTLRAPTSQTIPVSTTAGRSGSIDQLTESLITAIASSGATPDALANALEQAARQLREGK